ncbi:class I SAM-dependent methyltransferase [Heyndrickxia sp. NPDC080065]|uniref:class I SAM-dependent methyltransferase n=1 Tax=Heyndrickxia sp. NPDC080065 TaxID=3390568 RepID=UPI003D080630
MKLLKILDFAHTLLKEAINVNDIVIDATVGNGYDTAFLSHLVGSEGLVYGFDIQNEAILSAKKYLEEKNLTTNVVLFNKGHETIMNSIPMKHYGKISGAIFNLGYLPGGNKHIVTQANTTILAIKQLLEIIKPEGIIVLVIYHGHPEGAIERDAVINFVESIDQKKAHVLKYQFINQRNNPPFIIAIEKR